MMDVDVLVESFIEGSLTECQLASLSEWIEADSDHAKLFMQAIAVHVGIRNHFLADDEQRSQQNFKHDAADTPPAADPAPPMSAEGGVAWPQPSQPQQTTTPVPD